MKTETNPTGVVNCLRLHIHSEPSLDSDIVCKIRYLSELEVNLEESTEGFYTVYTETGAEGFCQKELVTLR